MVLARLADYTGEKRYTEAAHAALESFAAVAPQYGLFAASYSLALGMRLNPPPQVVVLGQEGDPLAEELERAALSIYRFGMAVLRVIPEQLSSNVLPPALAATLPHVPGEAAQALVCVGGVCRPPVTDPAALRALLVPNASSAASS
jgi:uncharacterized protein YyaL (SSP411 family)